MFHTTGPCTLSGMDPPFRFAVLTASDRAARGARSDESGPLASALLREGTGGECAAQMLLPDDRAAIAREIVRLADGLRCDLVVTTGGTGLGPRDVTPEATRDAIDREAPGIGEALRAAGRARTPLAALSRGTAGMRGRTLVVNLPGSPRAVQEGIAVLLPILPHAIRIARGGTADCAAENR